MPSTRVRRSRSTCSGSGPGRRWSSETSRSASIRAMPTVAQFSIAPVRSLGLQHPTEIDVTEVGVVEDRRFFLSDDQNRLVDRIVVGRLVQVEAKTDPGATRLWMRFPDGTVIDQEVEL